MKWNAQACSSDRVVIRLFDIERTIQLTTDKFCPMQKWVNANLQKTVFLSHVDLSFFFRITPTTGRDESLRILLTQNGDTLPYYLLFSRKRTSRKVVEHVNYVLRMFSEDQVSEELSCQNEESISSLFVPSSQSEQNMTNEKPDSKYWQSKRAM